MHRVELGAPRTLEGANSAYVLPDAGAVVDPGPPTADSWERLTAGIRRTGLDIEDVDHVLVTHWHGDHSGLAPRLADRAGASVYVHPADAAIVRDYAGSRPRRRRRAARTLERWGTPGDVVEAVRRRDSSGAGMSQCPVVELSDGDEVAGLDVLHTPGHTCGHVAYEGRDGPFVGDVVLPTYTPNVGGSDVRVEEPLETYLRSLGRLAGSADVAFPGHGEAFELDERIEEIVEHHEERNRRICSILLDRAEPSTPWTVATALFGEMEGVHAQMGVGEAAAHMGYLTRRGAVERVDDDPLTVRLEERPEPRTYRIDLSA
ncbi:MBL fold metallo-hydrolase [Natronomonas marina]|jgi:glyoxylase-like metal-dependent hydrolase (beta-lactamase superfamily II)|uniref:MBL fold metallo-hydrolase n=1 Tax=Natronomonas marina TaxID=2961939 RepID=UPI0020C9AAA4|nr:MBL fold metallo-hydrolase [Natronomonas marina]